MTAASPLAALPATGFRHEALLYASEPEFLGAIVPFIREGLDHGEPILAVLGRSKIDAVRDAMGGESDQVLFADMTELGQNPARIIPAWRDFVDGGPVRGSARRGISEPIWHGRSDVELIECQRHESLLNVAFDTMTDWWLLCPYNTTDLDEAIIDEARRSHPHLLVDGHHEASPALASDMSTAYLDAPLPPAPTVSGALPFGSDDIRMVRDHVASHVVLSGMDAERGFDLLVAVTEIATNSLLHGGGRGELRVWHDEGTVICEVSDHGALGDPLAGREAPSVDREGQRGLWIANQLCDLVQIRVYETGTVVRLHMAVAPA
jgi:anti-sigma regulatory factor (Ser/Thr protein kinase)